MFNVNRGGVRVPEGQNAPRTDLPPNKVLNVSPLSFCAVEYTDSSSAKRTTVAVNAGGKLYTPPNAEEWASALTGCHKWFEQAVLSRLPKQKAEDIGTPSKDTVQILSTSDGNQETGIDEEGTSGGPSAKEATQ